MLRCVVLYVLRCLAAACVPPGCGVAHIVSCGVLPQAKRGGRSSVSKIRAGGKLGAGGGKPGAGAGAGDAGKCKCKHLPSIREKAVMTALAKLAVGDLAFCDVRCTCLFVVWHPCGTRVADACVCGMYVTVCGHMRGVCLRGCAATRVCL